MASKLQLFVPALFKGLFEVALPINIHKYHRRSFDCPTANLEVQHHCEVNSRPSVVAHSVTIKVKQKRNTHHPGAVSPTKPPNNGMASVALHSGE